MVNDLVVQVTGGLQGQTEGSSNSSSTINRYMYDFGQIS